MSIGAAREFLLWLLLLIMPVTTAIIVGLSAVAIYLGTRLAGARAEIAALSLQNARLKRRLDRGAP